MYSTYYTRNNPGLWVLLTDESEESIRVINSMIQHAIDINFNGAQVYNKCYIHILGYNGYVKLLRSGNLEDFGCHPLRVLDQERLINDGAGGVIKINCKKPIWVDPYCCRQKSCLLDAIEGTRNFINQTIEFHREVPAPIVFNISKECSADSKLTDAINRLKDIKVHDGSLLFVNGGAVESKESIFKEEGELCKLTSQVPKSADFLYRSMIYMSNWNDKHDVEFNLNWINCTKYLSFNMLYMDGLVRLFMNVDDDSMLCHKVYDNCRAYINSLDDRI